MVPCCALFVVTHLNIPMNKKPVAGLLAFHRNRSKFERGSSDANEPESEDTLRRTDANYPGPNGGFSGTASNPYAPTENSRTIPTIRLQDLYGPRTFEKPAVSLPGKLGPDAPASKPSQSVSPGILRSDLVEKPAVSLPGKLGPDAPASKPSQSVSPGILRSDLVEKPGGSLTVGPALSDGNEKSVQDATRLEALERTAEKELLLLKLVQDTQKQNETLREENDRLKTESSVFKLANITINKENEIFKQQAVEKTALMNDLVKQLSEANTKQASQEKRIEDLVQEIIKLKNEPATWPEIISNITREITKLKTEVVALTTQTHILMKKLNGGNMQCEMQTDNVSESSFDPDRDSDPKPQPVEIPNGIDDPEVDDDSSKSSTGSLSESIGSSPDVAAVSPAACVAPQAKFRDGIQSFLEARIANSEELPAFWKMVHKHELVDSVYGAFIEISEELSKIGAEYPKEKIEDLDYVYKLFSAVVIEVEDYNEDDFAAFLKNRSIPVTTSMFPGGLPSEYKKSFVCKKFKIAKFVQAAITVFLKWNTVNSRILKSRASSAD